MLRIILLAVLLCVLSACGNANSGQSTANSSGSDGVTNSDQQTTKEIELFNMVMTTPESCFIPSKDTPGYNNTDENIEYLLFFEDEKDSEEKWRNQCIIQNMKGVNATPNITYDQARTVVADPAQAMFGINPQWKVISKESIDLNQTPALHYIVEWESFDATMSVWFAMSNYHDVMIFQFIHRNKAKYDFTDTFDYIVRNIHFKGLDGDSAFVTQTSKPSSSGSSQKACDGEPYGAGSDWANYDKNGDGCINDSEFQAGMGDAIENKVNGTSSGQSNSDRTGLCEFKENGKYVCNKKAMSGYSYCKEHWDLLYGTYNSLVGN